jgi:hypothetical protein
MSWLTESLIDDECGITYEFDAGFDFSRKFGELQRNHQDDYAKVCSGEPHIDIFIAVLSSSIVRVNGEDVKEHEKKEMVELIISKFGSQACSYVCHKIMHETYVGEIETKKSQTRQKWAEIQHISSLSSPGIFSKAGLLWIMTAALSGAVGCGITSGLLMLG